MSARLRTGSLLSTLCLAAACGASDPDDRASLEALRAEVATLRAQATARLEADTAARAALQDGADIVVGLRTDIVQQVMARAVERYLADVRLHLRPDVVVTESGDVRVRVGPIGVRAGRWQLAVTIRRIDARLRADSVALAVADSARLHVRVPVHVLDGSGDALIDFRWDAAAVTGVVCGDFGVREQFTGFVEPRRYDLDGSFVLEASGDGLVARPVLDQRIAVSPQPTERSWSRVRQLLDEQDKLFNCGLALSPARMEAMLRELLTRGFRFQLPESILRPLPLPASIADEVAVAGRRVAAAIRPRPPRLTQEWLWLSADLDASLLSASPGAGAVPPVAIHAHAR